MDSLHDLPQYDELLQYEDTAEVSASASKNKKTIPLDQITTIVLKYFPYPEIVDKFGYITVNVLCNNPEYYSKILGNMLEFHIMDTHIYVETLIKCDSLNGTAVLNYITNIAYELRATVYPALSHISLTDGSALVMEGIVLDLRTLYILIHGESWYNQRGFYSTQHTQNVSHNAQIRGASIGSFPALLDMLVASGLEIDPASTLKEVVALLYEGKIYQPLQQILLHIKDLIRYNTALKYVLYEY